MEGREDWGREKIRKGTGYEFETEEKRREWIEEKQREGKGGGADRQMRRSNIYIE